MLLWLSKHSGWYGLIHLLLYYQFPFLSLSHNCSCVTDMIYYTSLFFVCFSVFFISGLPKHTPTSFPLPSVQCVSEYRHQTQSPTFAVLPSAGVALRLACRRVIAEWPKVTLMETEGSVCLSALPPRAVHPPISAVAWLVFVFFPVLLEPCQQTPLDRDMQILLSENSQPSRSL